MATVLPTEEEMIQRLSTVSCPPCGKSDFLLIRKLPPAEGEGAFTALCKNCRYSFPVSTENSLYLRSNPDAVFWLNGLHCPKCMEQGVDLEFRCTLSVREHRIFVHCRQCGHAFNELAASEAYE